MPTWRFSLLVSLHVTSNSAATSSSSSTPNSDSITAALHPSPPHSIIIINPKFRRSCSRARAPICSGAAIKAARAPIFGGERIPAKLQQARAPICSGAVAIKEARASICSGAAAIKAARAPIFGSEQRRAAAPPARGRSQLLSLRDPVYGCVGVISLLQHQLRQLQMDLSCAKSELSKYQSLGGAISGHHHHHGLIAAAAAHHQGINNFLGGGGRDHFHGHQFFPAGGGDGVGIWG
ncbi:lob domain-containing protein [Castilleja foliolosa]|uniref:Lob domain-containing protein n=1 Tax=Castilleja foliolosa TaxID=1961234 RepID=A0ABD3DLY9_9LAMI